MPEQPPLPPAQVPAPAPNLKPKKTPWVLYGCGGILALIALMVATVFITIWWIQRPIRPVVLSANEKAAVDTKLRAIEAEKPSPSPNQARTAKPTPPQDAPPDLRTENPPYLPGSKTIRLTQREINGLLNQNTDLGNTVRLEFDRDAINAYVATPIPKDVPVLGGKMFRARGRFKISIGSGGTPFAILEDVTVFGISLPKAWLGGIKGENLLQNAVGEHNGSPVLKGIKSLRVEPGALVLELQD